MGYSPSGKIYGAGEIGLQQNNVPQGGWLRPYKGGKGKARLCSGGKGNTPDEINVFARVTRADISLGLR